MIPKVVLRDETTRDRTVCVLKTMIDRHLFERCLNELRVWQEFQGR